MYKYITLISLSLAVLFAICLMSFADSVDLNGDEAIYSAPKVTVPPKIDGVLDDIIWELAPSVTLGLINEGGTVDEERFSTAWACYDSETIYVAFKNLDPNPKQITVQNKKHDSPVWKDEENELFIEPANVGSKPYFHIMINAENVVMDAESGGAETAWEPKSLESATKVYNDHWVLELSISFDDLDVKEAPVGETWGWNFNRHIVSGITVWTGWAETGPSFHTPSKFGDFVFTKEELAVNPKERIFTTWGKIKSSF